MRPLKEASMSTNLAYVAGLIDGEGCIHLDTPRRTYRARVSVGMTKPALPLLESLKEEWGGTLYRLRPATERWAEAWTWHLTGAPATDLLQVIRPFLRLKGAQADAALEVEQIRARLSRRANGQFAWTEEARQSCESVNQRLRSLNAKGPRVPASSVGGA